MFDRIKKKPRPKFWSEMTVEHLSRIVTSDFKSTQGIDLREDALAIVRVREEIRKMLREGRSEIHLPFITADHHGPKHILMKLKPAEIEKWKSAEPEVNPVTDDSPPPFEHPKTVEQAIERLQEAKRRLDAFVAYDDLQAEYAFYRQALADLAVEDQ